MKPSSYIKTEASQVTRAADVASMTGTNFSDWYQQDEGTFVVDYHCDHISGTIPPSVWYTKGGDGDGFGHSAPPNSKDIAYDIYTGGVSSAYLLFSNTKDDVRSAFAYKLNDTAASFGANVLTDTDTTIPAVNKLDIGCRNNIAQPNGHIRNLTYYPRRITNEQLQALTSI